ncbi:hypothetical protein HDU76_010742, partial [Blyttiomyces sp. JEL0837]
RIPRAYCIFVDFFHDSRIKKLDPELAASKLNETFCKFDEILADFPTLEKIKTISSKCMLMAIDDSEKKNAGLIVTKLVKKLQKEEALSHGFAGLKSDVKVGVAYGSIVAGIVGSEKFIYDIYSDTVNCASRMANLEFTDKACTVEAYLSYDPKTRCLWRSLGTHQVKGKGLMEVFTLQYGSDDNVHDLPTPRASVLNIPKVTVSQTGEVTNQPSRPQVHKNY